MSSAMSSMHNQQTLNMLCPDSGCPAKIPVGGGYYIPGDPWKLREEVEMYRLSLLVVFGAFIWEHAVTFWTEELERWKQLFRGEIVPVNVLTLTARYATYGAIGAVVAYAWDYEARACQFKLSFLISCLAFMWISLASIFCLRIFAMYSSPNDKWTVRIPVTILLICCSGVWIASVVGFKAQKTSPAALQPYLSGCSPAPSPRWRAMGWGASAVYDIVIIWLSLHAVQRRMPNKHAIYESFSKSNRGSAAHFIVVSSLIAFLVSFIGNVICFFVTVFSNNLILSNVPIGIAALFNVIVASRLVFHSNLWSQGKSALLTMPHSYRLDRDSSAPPRYANRGQRFHLSKNGNPFDQLTIDQALEEQARLDAVAWQNTANFAQTQSQSQSRSEDDDRIADEKIISPIHRLPRKPAAIVGDFSSDHSSPATVLRGRRESDGTAIDSTRSTENHVRYMSRLEKELALDELDDPESPPSQSFGRTQTSRSASIETRGQEQQQQQQHSSKSRSIDSIPTDLRTYGWTQTALPSPDAESEDHPFASIDRPTSPRSLDNSRMFAVSSPSAVQSSPSRQNMNQNRVRNNSIHTKRGRNVAGQSNGGPMIHTEVVQTSDEVE